MAFLIVGTLRADQTLGEVRSWIAQGGPGSLDHGFPMLQNETGLPGVLSQHDLLDPEEPATSRVGDLVSGQVVAVLEDNSLRQAFYLMAREGLGRLPVVERGNPCKTVAIISGSDLRAAIRKWLEQSSQSGRVP